MASDKISSKLIHVWSLYIQYYTGTVFTEYCAATICTVLYGHCIYSSVWAGVYTVVYGCCVYSIVWVLRIQYCMSTTYTYSYMGHANNTWQCTYSTTHNVGTLCRVLMSGTRAVMDCSTFLPRTENKSDLICGMLFQMEVCMV